VADRNATFVLMLRAALHDVPSSLAIAAIHPQVSAYARFSLN
jgi:hypothetical protein